jgi:hypothetical protein
MSYAFFRQADNLLCILQVLTLCSSFSEISRIKNSCGDFLHPGSLDPQRLTKEVEGSHARPWWRNGQGSPGHACTHGSPTDHTGGDGGARGRTGRGPTGPEAHREGTCGAGLAGDGPAAAESGGSELGFLQAKRRRWRCFRRPRPDSRCEDDEGGSAELLEASARRGGGRNSGAEQRPWRSARARVGGKGRGGGEQARDEERGG